MVFSLVAPGLTRGPALFEHLRMRERPRGGWVYIMANRYRGTLYVGVTARLWTRVDQHKRNVGAEFCRRHRLHRLVWAERCETMIEGIAHEKRLKRWHRDWKFALIEKINPDWLDLHGVEFDAAERRQLDPGSSPG